MDTLESQVAKIQIGNFKQTASYVLTFAEKASVDSSELYAVIELPLFNPAALGDCERIAKALPAVLQRIYKRGTNENTFESALGEINEELGKLATLGQTNWIGKLNGAIAVKTDTHFTIATTGKISALLFRDNEFTDIADSPKSRHPLKTFENYATGKLKAGDLLVLSTSELFNHISIDRLKGIIKSNALSFIAEQVVKILEQNAGPEVAFGTLLIYESTPQAEVQEETINLEEYLPKDRSFKALIKNAGVGAKKLVTHHKVKSAAKNIFLGAKKLVTKKPNISIGNMTEQTKKNLQHLRESSKAFTTAPMQKFSGLSKSKKFFVISAAILLIAVIANILIARTFKQTKQDTLVYTNMITELKNFISQADGSLLYNNEENAKSSLALFNTRVSALTNLTEVQKKEIDGLKKQADTLNKKINKTIDLSVTNLGSLSAAQNLIVLPSILATETNGMIISYNITTSAIEDGGIKSTEPVEQSVYTKNTQAVVFNGQGLSVWDFAKGTTTAPFYLNVPKSADLAGIAYYPTNERAYIIDRAKSQIVNFAITATGVSKPVVWSKTAPELANGLDLAIDGNVYVLGATGVNKYTQGKLANFNFPALSTPLSGKGKIFTNKDTQNIYVLDSGNNRVVVANKKGELVNILESTEFNNPADFTVDEAQKTLYILNNGSLLKATY